MQPSHLVTEMYNIVWDTIPASVQQAECEKLSSRLLADADLIHPDQKLTSTKSTLSAFLQAVKRKLQMSLPRLNKHSEVDCINNTFDDFLNSSPLSKSPTIADDKWDNLITDSALCNIQSQFDDGGVFLSLPPSSPHMNSQTLWKNDIGTASDVNDSTLSDGVTDNSSNMPVVPEIPVMRKNPPSTSLVTKKRKSASISVRARVQTKMANTQLHTSLNCSKTNFVPETQIDVSVIPDSQVQVNKRKEKEGNQR